MNEVLIKQGSNGIHNPDGRRTKAHDRGGKAKENMLAVFSQATRSTPHIDVSSMGSREGGREWRFVGQDACQGYAYNYIIIARYSLRSCPAGKTSGAKTSQKNGNEN